MFRKNSDFKRIPISNSINFRFHLRPLHRQSSIVTDEGRDRIKNLPSQKRNWQKQQRNILQIVAHSQSSSPLSTIHHRRRNPSDQIRNQIGARTVHPLNFCRRGRRQRLSSTSHAVIAEIKINNNAVVLTFFGTSLFSLLRAAASNNFEMIKCQWGQRTCNGSGINVVVRRSR